MRRAHADFAKRFALDRRWWWLVVALFAVAGGLAWDVTVSQRRADGIRVELAAMKAASTAASAPQLPAAVPAPPYDASAREMLAQHATPWPQLLSALEAVEVEGLRVVRVDYVASEAVARVETAFTRQAAVLEHAAGLNAGVPETGAAWRWSIERIDLSRGDGNGKAVIVGRWAQR
jgi:hypothetical protein